VNAYRLSIVTITKDDADGLYKTLVSAASLRAAGAEHLVVDGGSVPAAIHQPAGFVGSGVVFARPARGVTDAFNAGLAESKGEWVWFLNGGDRVDERLSPEFLFTLLHNSQADVIIGGITYDGTTDLRVHFPLAKQWPPLAAWIPHPSTIIRKSLFDRNGPFDTKYRIAMDYEWWLRALNRDTQVDVLAVPFARFAAGGISQRPESLPLILREQYDAIRRHQLMLWRTWIARGCRLALQWTRAQFSARLTRDSKL
jgi:glycosyltransferase involved in cell wall biosynthesis